MKGQGFLLIFFIFMSAWAPPRSPQHRGRRQGRRWRCGGGAPSRGLGATEPDGRAPGSSPVPVPAEPRTAPRSQQARQEPESSGGGVGDALLAPQGL